MKKIIEFSTAQHEELIDITAQVARVLEDSGMRDGLINVYAQGATAAIMIQESEFDGPRTKRTVVCTLLGATS